MDRFFFFRMPTPHCKNPSAALACAYLSGLLTGLMFSVSAGIPPVSATHAVRSGWVSVIGLLSAIALPLFFSAFAVYVGRRRLLIPISFCKAFLFAYTGSGIWAAFGSTGWLVFLLFLFSDILMLPVLWWYWCQALKGHTGASVTGLIPASAAGILIGCLDYFFIAPFLAHLLSY